MKPLLALICLMSVSLSAPMSARAASLSFASETGASSLITKATMIAGMGQAQVALLSEHGNCIITTSGTSEALLLVSLSKEKSVHIVCQGNFKKPGISTKSYQVQYLGSQTE